MDANELRLRLSMVVPFSAMPPAELDDLIDVVEVIRLEPDAVAHQPGVAAEGLDVLISGVVLREDPALATLGTRMGEISAPGTFFSKSALLRPVPHRHRLAAVGEVVLVRLPRESFLQALDEGRPMAQRLLDHLVLTIGADVREVNEIIHRLLAE